MPIKEIIHMNSYHYFNNIRIHSMEQKIFVYFTITKKMCKKASTFLWQMLFSH